jgi:hypothetical protein
VSGEQVDIQADVKDVLEEEYEELKGVLSALRRRMII